MSGRVGAYDNGKRQALRGVLGHVLRELGFEDSGAEVARLQAERLGAISALRELCAEVGDNEWSALEGGIGQAADRFGLSSRVDRLEADIGTLGGWADKRIAFLERRDSEQIEINNDLVAAILQLGEIHSGHLDKVETLRQPTKKGKA